MYARPSHPTPAPTLAWGTTSDASETTIVDLNAKEKPCSAKNAPRSGRDRNAAHPIAETANSAHETTSSPFLLSRSETTPLTGRMASAAVASSPAKNPATAREAPRETA